MSDRLDTNCSEKIFDVVITPKKLHGEILPPPSKSHLHRLLILAAFCGEKVSVNNVSMSDDIIATLNALKSIGAKFVIEDGVVKFDGFSVKPSATIDCKESGSTLRFFLPICGMLGINATFIGSKRLGERGYKDIIRAMSPQVTFDKNGGFPLEISGTFEDSEINISGEISSQYISGIMLGAYAAKRQITIRVAGKLSSVGYVEMTIDAIKKFGGKVIKKQGCFEVFPKSENVKELNFMPEVDYSNLAFWEVAGVHLPLKDDNSLQRDKVILDFVKLAEKGVAFDVDVDQTPDLAPIFGVLLSNLKGVSTLKNCARLRAKECDRLLATAEVLNAFGVKADIVGDDLSIVGGKAKGNVTLDSYGDHRMAMMIAIMACFADGKVTVKNAQVVRKSYPNFWEDYKALGGEINVINDR